MEITSVYHEALASKSQATIDQFNPKLLPYLCVLAVGWNDHNKVAM